jgi:hypothetical protein
MRRAAFAVIASGLLTWVSVAKAEVWSFSYSGGGYSAAGEFVTGNSGSPYTVTGVFGTADGYAIEGLSTYASADQLLYYPASGGAYADFSGISFMNANGVAYNLSNYPSGNNIAISTLDPGGYGYSQVAVSMSVTPVRGGLSVPITPVPESTTWAMMILGFVGLAFAGYGARRTSVSFV